MAVLLVLLAALTALSWQRWGVPSFDAGLDLTVADRIANAGDAPYSDARYFYGPAGLYGLAAAFTVFGTSLTVAFAYGYTITIAILGFFYALARRWLAPLQAALATAVLMAIAFNGTFFDFVLPHTNAGTVGCLCVIVQVWLLSRGSEWSAGLVAGVALLTRVEFAGFAAAAVIGYGIGLLREEGARRALAGMLRAGVPALVLAVVVYIPFARAAGVHDLLFENLAPVDFAKFGGGALQRGWAPFDLDSAVATVARAALTLGPIAALVMGWERWSAGRRGAAVVPLAATVAVLALLAGLWQVSGVFDTARAEVRHEVGTLLIAMAWLPVVAVGALVVALLRARRGGSPLGISWPADLALLAGAAAAGVRGYNEFTPDSYAPYWAALPVLVMVVALDRLARWRPAVRPLALAVPALAAAALALHSWGGLMRDDTQTADTPRGSYRWYPGGARAVAETSRYIARTVPGRAPILVVADAPGIYFLSGHPSALYESTFLPGTLDTAADERAAIRRLQRRPPRLVVVGAQDTQNFGYTRFGRDYNRVLGAWIRRNYRPVRRFGATSRPTRDNKPAEAFTVLARRT